ncbi:MAG: hypothetical protein IJT58_07275 [Synergistaceae bacterium]|nr:hypothetical protein [Synergistaceae bacterium]
MPFEKVNIRTPDGRVVAQTTVNPNATSTLGTKVDRETGRRFEYRHEGTKMTSRWVD